MPSPTTSSSAVLLALVCLAFSPMARADDAAPAAPGGFGGRLYLGPAAGQGQSQGNGLVLGFQSAGGARTFEGYWGLQLLAVQIGASSAFVPLVSVDGGFLWSPLNTAWVRPHARLGIGATFLLILPLPAITAAIGVGIPIGDLFVLDLDLATRAALNPFDTTNNPRVLSIELGIAK